MIVTTQPSHVPNEKRLRYDRKARQYVEHSQTEPFLKGPIPLGWLSIAASLPGKALNVALAIRWLVGMASTTEIRISRKALDCFSVSDDAYRDGLDRLEGAGLINVKRQAGRRPLVTVLPIACS